MAMMAEHKFLYTIAETVDALGLSRSTIYELIDGNELVRVEYGTRALGRGCHRSGDACGFKSAPMPGGDLDPVLRVYFAQMTPCNGRQPHRLRLMTGVCRGQRHTTTSHDRHGSQMSGTDPVRVRISLGAPVHTADLHRHMTVGPQDGLRPEPLSVYFAFCGKTKAQVRASCVHR